MPRIFDNIDERLLPELQKSLAGAVRADFCVGYFNLRGWAQLAPLIEEWNPDQGRQCRLLVGMHRQPHDELRAALNPLRGEATISHQVSARLATKLAEDFREQLTFGVPTSADENALRQLSRQLRSKKLVVKMAVREPLHAKLYLTYRRDDFTPIIAFLGSSNLTLSGLQNQGELNVDVLEQDAAEKLAGWFENRWNDAFSYDISERLADILDESWVRRDLPPHWIYLKMAYELSREARMGLSEFTIPKELRGRLFEFQEAAVKIAARHLNRRGGVLLGDVVGLGKTMMATALMKVCEQDFDAESLIICPRNLVAMWQSYVDDYKLDARVMSVTRVIADLPGLKRHRIVVIDESHNLRNREGKRYKAIENYVDRNDSKCILLSATPYNKTFLDISAQLRLFLDETQDLGVRPEHAIRLHGEHEFAQRFQCSPRSLTAFEKSDSVDDWRELMRLFLVRRTRTFIQQNYAAWDESAGRKHLTFPDGTRSYFPIRVPRTVQFQVDENNPQDQYGRLFSDDVVNAIGALELPRYGLGKYVSPKKADAAPPAIKRQFENLSRAGKRLLGYCRTNLFKRLESSGSSFLVSLERHILRNFIFLHAVENGLPLPIGTQDAELLDTTVNDADERDSRGVLDFGEDAGEPTGDESSELANIEALRKEADFQKRAAEIYELYRRTSGKRFRWVDSTYFTKSLPAALKKDAATLLRIINLSDGWDREKDAKLDALANLCLRRHPQEKILVFTQFADTVAYLERELKRRFALEGFAPETVSGVTGDSHDPTRLAWRFSPKSNQRLEIAETEGEVRVLIATDVLSEGQNLQDCAVIVNFDLPWAIIRLIQRAGRVDRIGQDAAHIVCYSFLPTDGVERIIRLRSRVRQRLRENAEVVGTDEAFFEDEDTRAVHDLYHEKAGALDDDDESETDFASWAYQIWKNATGSDPKLAEVIPKLPNVAYSTKPATVHRGPAADRQDAELTEGVLVYVRTAEGNDALAWMDRNGTSVTESQYAILRAAECASVTPALPRLDEHHDLVSAGLRHLVADESALGVGGLGKPSGPRHRAYHRLKAHFEKTRNTLFALPQLEPLLDELYRNPLQPEAAETISRQLRAHIQDHQLADLMLLLRDQGRLCVIHERAGDAIEPHVICSLGLRKI
jgi:SNF2 family DNA or RNA helicase